jgi:hypothetical protein
MDDIVKAALKKWPQVPHCWGWLALDARGNWYMRDERTQAAGPFPQVKGSRIEHDKLLAFIHRNYLADAQGAWYFQNGPQRVYVALEAAPYVWRLQATPDAADVAPGLAQQPPAVQAHTGQPGGAVLGVWLDETGRLYLACAAGFGIVHTLDMHVAASAVEAGCWQPEELPFAQMPARFGYCLQPAPQEQRCPAGTGAPSRAGEASGGGA